MLRGYRMALIMALALESMLLDPWEQLLAAWLVVLSAAWTGYWVSTIGLDSIVMSLSVITLLTNIPVRSVLVGCSLMGA
jgi:hypothetical protein